MLEKESFPEADIRALVRSLGKGLFLPNSMEVRDFWLNQLARHVAADLWVRALEHISAPGLFIDAESGSPHSGFRTPPEVAKGEALVTIRRSFSSPDVHDLRCVSLRLPGEDFITVIAVLRDPGRPPFSSQEEALILLVLREGAPLFLSHKTLPKASVLSPRRRKIACRLSRGRSVKEVAADMNLSPHAVHYHLKAIHKIYGVVGRIELLRKLAAEELVE